MKVTWKNRISYQTPSWCWCHCHWYAKYSFSIRKNWNFYIEATKKSLTLMSLSNLIQLLFFFNFFSNFFFNFFFNFFSNFFSNFSSSSFINLFSLIIMLLLNTKQKCLPEIIFIVTIISLWVKSNQVSWCNVQRTMYNAVTTLTLPFESFNLKVSSFQTLLQLHFSIETIIIIIVIKLIYSDSNYI